MGCSRGSTDRHPTTATGPGQDLRRQPWHSCRDRPDRGGTHRTLHGDATRGRARSSGRKVEYPRWLEIGAHFVEMRERSLPQIKAPQKLGTAELLDDVDAEPDGIARHSDPRDGRADPRETAGDDTRAETAASCAPSWGSGPFVSAMLAEIPEREAISAQQTGALTGLAPSAYDSGMLPERGAITGRKRALRHVLFQAALVAGPRSDMGSFSTATTQSRESLRSSLPSSESLSPLPTLCR